MRNCSFSSYCSCSSCREESEARAARKKAKEIIGAALNKKMLKAGLIVLDREDWLALRTRANSQEADVE